MKVGFFVSGQIRVIHRISELMLNFKKEVPFAEFIGACWKSCENTYDLENLKKETGIRINVFPDITLNYKPYQDNINYDQINWSRIWNNKIDEFRKKGAFKTLSDNPTKEELHLIDRLSHQTKQILIHNEMMRKYKGQYDVIIRGRWDGALGSGLALKNLVDECYEHKALVTLFYRSGYPIDLNQRMLTFDSHCTYLNKGIPSIEVNRRSFTYIPEIAPWIHDGGLIIHRDEDWDCDLVDTLHKNKNLLPAEWGWCQILRTPGNRRYLHYDGGCTVVRK